MASIFLTENTQVDGTVLGEDDFCGAAATSFNGKVYSNSLVFMLRHRCRRD